VMSRAWAGANPKTVENFLAGFNKSVAWFNDEKNRDAAIAIMVDFSKNKPEDVGKAYDFLRGKHLFEPTGKVSRAKLGTVITALRELGDIGELPVEKLLLPGVTETTD
jgi:ABC-type nitrate/sulfonate/bicarbonate transport system substrate-binding protein